jgi:hypothetical protein
MLGNRGRGQSEQLGNLANAKLALPERQQDSEPGFIGQGFGKRHELAECHTSHFAKQRNISNPAGMACQAPASLCLKPWPFGDPKIQ